MIPADEQATEVIAPAAPATAGRAARRRSPGPAARAGGDRPPRRPPTRQPRGRAARIWITVVAIVVALVALVVVADVIVRNIAEARFAEEIEANLPDGVEGDVGVTIGGLSVIAQYLSGTMQHVELSAPELVVEGVPIAVDVVGEGVPVDLALPVEHLTATIEADAAAVNRLIDVQGIEGELAFGDGTVGYTDSVRFLGFPIEFTVTARADRGGRHRAARTRRRRRRGRRRLDRRVGHRRPAPRRRPDPGVRRRAPARAGVEVQQLTVEPTGATVALEADGLRLDEASLATLGSCD